MRFVYPLEQTVRSRRGIPTTKDLGPLRPVSTATLDLDMEVPSKVLDSGSLPVDHPEHTAACDTYAIYPHLRMESGQPLPRVVRESRSFCVASAARCGATPL